MTKPRKKQKYIDTQHKKLCRQIAQAHPLLGLSKSKVDEITGGIDWNTLSVNDASSLWAALQDQSKKLSRVVLGSNGLLYKKDLSTGRIDQWQR